MIADELSDAFVLSGFQILAQLDELSGKWVAFRQDLVELSLLFIGEGSGDPSLAGVQIDPDRIGMRNGFR